MSGHSFLEYHLAGIYWVLSIIAWNHVSGWLDAALLVIWGIIAGLAQLSRWRGR